jgi:regulation of enolase protein 1 (concanavalin A-like superfamily)
VWGTADAFHFAYRPLSGDGTIVARVASINGADSWTKAGVMIRTATDGGSAHAFMLVSRGKGLALQRRKSNGASSLNTSGGSGTAPRWVKLTRAGNTISAYSSTNGSSWTLVGSDTFSMPADVLVGVAVTSHEVATLATATFDNVSVSDGQALPAGWSSNDIGAVGKRGSASHNGGTFTVQGAGDDIWGTADALHLAWRTLSGDGDIVARVASVNGSMSWTKVGVMMRQSLDAGSAQALMLVSAGKGIRFQRRPVTGGSSLDTDGGVGTAPQWVKLTRAGQVVTASISADGTTWRTIGSQSMSIVGEILVGLAVSSHTDLAIATGTFDDVQVRER